MIFFDHTRKITHDLLLLIRESIASFFFSLYLFVYIHELNNSSKGDFSFIESNGYIDYYEYHICILQLKGSMYQQAFVKKHISKSYILLLVSSFISFFFFNFGYKTFWNCIKILYLCFHYTHFTI